MNKNTVILLAEDDEGHAGLIIKNLNRSGIDNEILHFRNGQETLDFLFGRSTGSKEKEAEYILLLDIRMPKVDGIEVLRQIKDDKELNKMPVIMVTTTDEAGTVKLCKEIGCCSYVVKPVNYDEFIETINQLGVFLQGLR